MPVCFCIRCTLIRLSAARTAGEFDAITLADSDHQAALACEAAGEPVAHSVVLGERVA